MRHIAYAALFVVVLPLALWLWAKTGNGSAFPPPPQHIGIALTACGTALMAWACALFVLQTGKLPVSTDTPPDAVTSGPYRLVSDPLYVSFCIMVAGASCLLQNRFAFWLVTPSLIAATIAFTTGYENYRRPPRSTRALFDWPENAERTASLRDRFAVVLNVFVIAALVMVPALPLPKALAAAGLAALITAPFVSFGHIAAASLRRGLAVVAIASTAIAAGLSGPHMPFIAFATLLGVCAAAFAIPFEDSVPATVVLVLAASLLAIPLDHRAAPAPLVGAAVAFLLPPLHRAMLRLCEAIANSWSAWRIGPMRIINYAIYPFVGALIGGVIFLSAAPGNGLHSILVIGICGLIGAGLWGQLLERTGRLARPFGYFGFLIGASLGTVAMSLLGGGSLGEIAGAGVLTAPWVQSIGRLRCLVQGCCHGRPVGDPALGIVYRRQESRVTRIGKLGGVPVHPTPLYSIYGNILLGILLFRLVLEGMPAALVAGAYLIGAGAARFVEESYRGEPQTKIVFDLKVYQWFALAEAMTGAVLTVVPSPALALHMPTVTDMAAAGLVALLAAAAMGVDFPTSSRRFSQLTPK